MESEECKRIVEGTEDIFTRLPLAYLSFACDVCEDDEVGYHLCVPRLMEAIEFDDDLMGLLEDYLNGQY